MNGSTDISNAVVRLFAAIAKAATEISGGDLCGAFLLDQGKIHFVTAYNFTQDAVDAYRRDYPIEAAPSSLIARVILNGVAVNLDDITTEAAFYSHAGRGHLSYRAVLITPIHAEGKAFAAFGIGRYEAMRFSDRTVEQIKSLADVASVGLTALGCARPA